MCGNKFRRTSIWSAWGLRAANLCSAQLQNSSWWRLEPGGLAVLATPWRVLSTTGPNKQNSSTAGTGGAIFGLHGDDRPREFFCECLSRIRDEFVCIYISELQTDFLRAAALRPGGEAGRVYVEAAFAHTAASREFWQLSARPV